MSSKDTHLIPSDLASAVWSLMIPVNALQDRAECIPSTTARRRSEERRVINDLTANGYPENFIKSVDQPNNAQPKPRENPKAYASIAHFRVALSLYIKARPGAQPFIWKWV